jgi:predicted MPP superfamily phosphohydrolase
MVMIMRTYKMLIFSGIFLMLILSPLTSNGKSLNSKISGLHNFTPYKFIALGDTRPEEGDNTGLGIIADMIEDIQKNHQIEFILHSGDMVEQGADQSDWDTYYWPLMTEIANQIPIYYAVGNHEYYTKSVGGYNLSLVTYVNNVENPGNEIFYSFNSPQNDTHFIVLNTDYIVGDIAEDVIKAAEQQQWLENELVNNSYDRTIIMTHRPFWGLNPADDRIEPIEEIRTLWHPLFIENGVDMVLSGHAHNFYQTVRNGTDYTTSGGGTVDFSGVLPDHPEIKPTILPEDKWIVGEYHLCLVEATIEGFNIDVIVSNGSVVYEYSVPAVLDIEETTSLTTTSHYTSTTTTTSASTSVELPFSIIALLISTKILYTYRKKKR